ncbi:unnamed protein product [Sphenostylis stenocarpa]|uniref:Uncharacterized protein n=1 Tax=Sphenostylis stenocarpa TaxID=92480 RepID=A0AA86SIN4_9FABA|nr:unnamed protein product [Sphenostylis stenocarpa]
MSTLFVFSVFLLLSVATLCVGYDYFMLAETWPKSYCNYQSQTGGRLCYGTVPKHFTIHGLWPEEWTRQIHNCNATNTLNQTHIQPVRRQLTAFWPNLNGNDFSFWKFEWDKHGTCSENSFAQLPYFQLALNIKGRINLLKMLSQDQIVPDNRKSYNTTSVIDAIRKGTNHAPQLDCYVQRTNNVTILAEVRLCLDVNGTSYINCPNPSGSCATTDLYWPKP